MTTSVQHDGKTLPALTWVSVPEGTVELPEFAGTFEASPFKIAPTPVTNAQFQEFMEAGGGYCSPDWWDAEWLEDWLDQGWAGRRATNQPDSDPRTNVSWIEAMAYCRWLNHKHQSTLSEGQQIRLPTEWEWQQAVQYTEDASIFEWCLNHYADAANTSSAGNRARVLRGGGWSRILDFCHAAYRSGYSPDDRSDNIGFRVCLSSPIQNDIEAKAEAKA